MAEELDSIVAFSVDLADQEAPPPLPVGSYRASVRSAEVKLSQMDNKYGAVGFYITADDYPVDFVDGPEDGMTIIYRRVGLEDNPQARYGTRRFCEALGAPLSKEIDVTEWVGLEAMVEVVHTTYEGTTRAEIKSVNPA